MTPDHLSAATPERPIRVGRYDVTGLIRAGGMGIVYDAIDRDHGTRVALKTLNHLGPESLLRFKNEFRAVADLSHPNLVSLYELGCHDELWFFTMERVDGVDFITHLRGATPSPDVRRSSSPTSPTVTARDPHPPIHGAEPSPSLPPSMHAVRDALAQIVRGVRALHAAGLLHLDLKPSNVLVDRAGRVVVLDFGLVRPIGVPPPSVQPDADSWTISGTPEWMAPEQYVGQGIGEAADWYAVGLMLYLALTGVRPFTRATTPVTWFAKLNAQPTPPARLLEGVPADLSALAMALLASDATARPTGEEVAAIAGGAADAPIDKSARAALVGRAEERAVLARALGVARQGGTAIVHLLGPSGVGKSALLDAMIDEGASDAIVLRGRCYERETVPYKAFDGMLDALALRLAGSDEVAADELPEWIADLARVFPVLARAPAIAARVSDDAPSSGVELRRRAAVALRGLFATLAARRPLVLVIDDVQWADADSASLLVKLFEAPVPRGLVVVASLRPVEASLNVAIGPYLAAVRDLRGGVHRIGLDVETLPFADAERLARERLAALRVKDDDHALAAAIAHETGGLPFFVEELAHHVARGHDDANGTSGVALESVLARRVRALSPTERAIVKVLAVADNPVPLGVALSVAGVASGAVRALWSLRAGHFVRGTGAGPDDRVELHHDRTRKAVLEMIARDEVDDLHVALGRALVSRDGDDGPFLFDAVRHLNAAAHRLAADERARTARLDLAAGRRARRAAAFPLAFDCFRAGARLLGQRAWATDYDAALALHGGAAEAAYLSGAWSDVDTHVAEVKANARTILDQLVAFETQIDACIARNEYAAAVDAGLEALRRLDVDLPANPNEADVGAELKSAMEALARVGPDGLASLANADDAVVAAAMRLESRICSAAYFARPMLLPLLACRLVATSVAHGLSPATPYALAIYGIVLNTIGMYRDAHTWGNVALRLLDRFDDKSLEARTRHVVHDLVCTFTVPLAGTLDDLRAVIAIGKQTGDLEYAGYAAHAYVHNSFYAARNLDATLDDALAFGAMLRGYGQVNALHVHAPFEQLLRCFTGRARDPALLDGDGFDEAVALEAARAAGSRSAQHIVHLLMGIVRYHFGSTAEASACFEAARPFLDGVASTWHVPIFHQYAALAIHALYGDAREKLREPADASLAALRAFAAQGSENFAHRVDLVEAERARADGDIDAAIELFGRAIAGAERGGWHNDAGLAHELAARCHASRGDRREAGEHERAARAAFARWGAHAKTRTRRDGSSSP